MKLRRFVLPLIVGIVVSQVALVVLYLIVVGDPCRFHAPRNDIPNWFIRVFFPILPEANFHPEPGLLIEGLFIFCGCLGTVLWRFKNDRKHNRL